jgi:hypothetical protein
VADVDRLFDPAKYLGMANVLVDGVVAASIARKSLT